MEQTELGPFGKSTKFDRFSRDELIERNQALESELARVVKEVYRLKYQHLSEEQLNMVLREHLAELNAAVYGASSERYKKPVNKPKKEEPSKPRVRLPSERYPNVPVKEISITMDPSPGCESCGKQMSDSGMTEDSEQLTVMPKKYEILRFKRAVYRCSCQSCMKTAALPPRIIEGSTYSDEMILDVVLSKYCDLIPMERYVQMAKRGGLMDLPPNSLIDLTHKFAFFACQVYRQIEAEIFKSRVLAADETPHKMLEGSDTKNWYLWGFSTPTLCYLLARSTRSGDVAHDILAKSPDGLTYRTLRRNQNVQMNMVLIDFELFDFHPVLKGSPPQYFRAELLLMWERQHPLSILRRPDDMVLTIKDGVTASEKCHTRA